MLASHKNKSRRETKLKIKKAEIKLVLLNEEELIEQVCMRPVIYDRSLKGYRKMSLRKQCWTDISRVMECTEEECRKRWRSLRDSFAKHYKVAQKGGNVANKQRKWVFYDKMSFLIPHIDGVSYDLDNILDELGDISEDGGSISSEPIGLNSVVEEELVQSELPMENGKDMKNHREEFQENLQHISVSVQATDLMPIPPENPYQSSLNICDNNSGVPRHQNSCRNPNNCSNTTFCGESNGDNAVLFDSDEKFLLSCAPTLRRLTHRQNALARLKIQQILFDIEFDQTSS